jgi:hypothetical protein
VCVVSSLCWDKFTAPKDDEVNTVLVLLADPSPHSEEGRIRIHESRKVGVEVAEARCTGDAVEEEDDRVLM